MKVCRDFRPERGGYEGDFVAVYVTVTMQKGIQRFLEIISPLESAEIVPKISPRTGYLQARDLITPGFTIMEPDIMMQPWVDSLARILLFLTLPIHKALIDIATA
jgi:hypothetical protein